jgi:acyl dehydratase
MLDTATGPQSINANKIRFPAPVHVDARVRDCTEVVSIDGKGGGWYERQRLSRFPRRSRSHSRRGVAEPRLTEASSIVLGLLDLGEPATQYDAAI